MSTKKSRTTYNQLDAMVNYLEQNKELLLNKGSKKNSEKWTELCNILNNLGRGPVKSTKEWKRVLIEWKYNTKRRSKSNINNKRLSNAEERLLKLLSEIPNEDINPLEIQFVQVLVEEINENHIETVKVEPLEIKIKEVQVKEDIKDKHFNISTSEIKEPNNNTEFLPSTSNSVLIQDTEQSKEISKYHIEDNNITKNIIQTRYKRPTIKRRKFKRSNVLRKKGCKNNEEKSKSYVLAEAILKLAESNCKVAESNCKIAESNNQLAEALNSYTKTKQEELEN